VTAATSTQPINQVHTYRHRLDGIDVLRGISIFAVVILHINLRIRLAKTVLGMALPSQLVTALAWNGQNGVTIFFAVSGFLITTTALRRWKRLDQINLRDFYLLRFARIAPLLLLLLAVLSVLHLAHLPGFTIRPQQGTLGRALFAALTFHLNWFEAQRGYLPGNWDVLWSLSVEEMFYLFFPLLCRLLRGWRLTLLLLAFVVIGPFARTVFTHNPLWIEKSYLGSMDAIALGCLAAIALPRLRNMMQQRRALFTMQAAGVLMITLIMGFWPVNRWLGIYRTGLDVTVVAAGTCMVMLAVAHTQRQGRGISKPLRWFGEHSYEVYLTHMFVVLWMTQAFAALGNPMKWASAWYAAIFILSAILGAITMRGYSEPMNRWLRRKWVERSMRSGTVETASHSHPQ
jgi:peptidoglycan/LPS O-acetylase OafA/YrhL